MTVLHSYLNCFVE